MARAVGIRTWFSGQKPDDKLDRIKRYKNLGVVYVGDGINDAPALKAGRYRHRHGIERI